MSEDDQIFYSVLACSLAAVFIAAAWVTGLRVEFERVPSKIEKIERIPGVRMGNQVYSDWKKK